MKLLIKEILKALLIGVAIFIVSLIIYFVNGWEFTFQELAKDFWETIIFSTIIYLCNAASFIILMRKYDKELFTRKYIGYGIVGNIVASIIGIFLARLVLRVLIYKVSFGTFLSDETPREYYISFLIAMVVAILFYAAYYYKFYKEKQVKEQKIIAGSASARFDALKNQLDPHFLFNSLNVLTSLIDEDP
ncbi:MAG: histidine kinase, partial [Muricauda sp. TMED12]